MNNIESVIKDIEEGALKERTAVERQAKAEAGKIIKSADKKAEEIRSRSIEKAVKSSEEFEKREEALTKLESRRLVMEKRKEAIESIAGEMKEMLFALKGDEREEVLKSLAKRAGNTCWDKVLANKKDIPQAKKLFKGTVTEEYPIKGGFLLENENEGFSLNMSFENIFETNRKELIKEISEMLGEND